MLFCATPLRPFSRLHFSIILLFILPALADFGVFSVDLALHCLKLYSADFSEVVR